MPDITHADARDRANQGWLKSRHTFSFGGYYNPEQRRWLRPASAPHRNGALAHRDTLGTGSVIPGDVQVMSVGTGVAHWEFNHSKVDPVHFLQIWILPSENGAALPRTAFQRK